MSGPGDARASRLELLRCGAIEVIGRMPWSSNATFLVELTPCMPATREAPAPSHREGAAEAQRRPVPTIESETRARAIYKPLRGERPLWDFEPGLHRREVAAYHLSEAMGMDLVPPTIIRDGPLGEGSLQWFVEVDHAQHYFTIHEAREDLYDELRAVAAFDLIANNTDRKSGHVLIDADDHIWGIDHGLCFAADFKLRTVVWEFGGEDIPEPLVAAAEAIARAVPLSVATMLVDEEIDAVRERAQWLVDHPVFPVDSSGRRYPWPLV